MAQGRVLRGLPARVPGRPVRNRWDCAMKDIEEKTDTCRLGRGGGMDKDLTGHARQSCGCKRPSRICPIAWIVATRRARRDLQAAPGCGSTACWKLGRASWRGRGVQVG